MKKCIHAFLKVGFFLAIAYVALGVLLIPLSFIDGPHWSNFAWGIICVLFGVANLIGLIIVRQKWEEVKSKEEAKPIAIWSIVLGALLTGFPIAAGILMLVLPEDQYGKEEKAE